MIDLDVLAVGLSAAAFIVSMIALAVACGDGRPDYSRGGYDAS